MSDGASADARLERYEVEFWLWACLHDARELLEAVQRQNAIVQQIEPGADNRAWASEIARRRDRTKLALHHFVGTIGSLRRTLDRARATLPVIEHAVAGATHLASIVDVALPDGPLPLYVEYDGHWIADRINVERVVQEVNVIVAAARTMTGPQ